MSDSIRVGRRTVPVSNRDKMLFPEDGISKGRLIDYYAAIAPAMVPHLRGRPLTMERFPEGLNGQRFFQKNASRYFPEWITRASMPKKDGSVDYVVANDAATLVYLANQATVTHHLWLSTIDHPDMPDQLIFDLDPSREAFSEIREIALLVRELVAGDGLVPFVKTSGSRGLHVVVPLRPRRTFEVVYGYATRIAERVIAERPKLVTTEFHKANRGDRIFFDIGRNAYAQTTVAPYSVRARKGAPVAVPLFWDEVSDRSLRPDGFGMPDALKRAEGEDPWAGFRRAARTLKAPSQSG
jgi:bifunctional non-homologous end joining protein LigD